MAAFLVLAFIVVPLIELFVIIQVGQLIGPLWTIALLLAVSIAGGWLVKREGRRAWDAFRRALADGRWPGDEVAQGALILAGGALLLTPGFVSDAVGGLMLLPPTRALLARVIRLRFTPVPVQVFQSARNRGTDRPPPTTSRRVGSDTASDPLDVEVVSIEREDRPSAPERGG